MMPFEAYTCYLALKNHFTKDHYDRDGELSQKYIVNWKKAYKTTEYNEFDKWK